MAVNIQDGGGSAYLLRINSDGSLPVSGIFGGGSNVYVQSMPKTETFISGVVLTTLTGDIYISGATFANGSNVWVQNYPIDQQNGYTQLIYISSGTSTGVTGSSIGSIIKYVGAGSYVKVLTYSNNNLVNIGSWS